MFRQMRRFKQLLPQKTAVDILNRNTSGTLALNGDDDYPYAVPISYVYADGKLYFHSAKNGHKIDAIKKHGKASFCVIKIRLYRRNTPPISEALLRSEKYTWLRI